MPLYPTRYVPSAEELGRELSPSEQIQRSIQQVSSLPGAALEGLRNWWTTPGPLVSHPLPSAVTGMNVPNIHSGGDITEAVRPAEPELPGTATLPAGIPGAPAVRGRAEMSFPMGQIRPEELAQVAQRRDVSGFQPTQLELTRMAFMPQDVGMAPGARQYWGQELKGQIGAEDFGRLLDQRQQEVIQQGLTAQHPAVRAAAEAEARRRAYPSEAAGRAQIYAAQIGEQGRRAAAEATREAGLARERGPALAAVVNRYMQGGVKYKGESDEAFNRRRLGERALLNLILSGQIGADAGSLLGDEDEEQ